MNLSNQETEQLKAVCLNLIEKKHNYSGGHNGLSMAQIREILTPVLNELVKECKVVIRPTMHGESYFLNQLYYANRNQKSEDQE